MDAKKGRLGASVEVYCSCAIVCFQAVP